MGFSVTASHIIFGVALIGAFSVASNAYWKNVATIEHGQRVMSERAVKAAHANLSLVGAPTYAGTDYTFTIKNVGSVGLNFTMFDYVVDGTPRYNAFAASYPKLNGVYPAGSELLLPGNTLDVRITSVTPAPVDLKVATEFGIGVYYP